MRHESITWPLSSRAACLSSGQATACRIVREVIYVRLLPA